MGIRTNPPQARLWGQYIILLAVCQLNWLAANISGMDLAVISVSRAFAGKNNWGRTYLTVRTKIDM